MAEEIKKEKEIEEIEGERFVPKVIYDGKCDHYFEFSNHESSGLDAYSCNKCICGILVNPKTHIVLKGKLKEKNG